MDFPCLLNLKAITTMRTVKLGSDFILVRTTLQVQLIQIPQVTTLLAQQIPTQWRINILFFFFFFFSLSLSFSLFSFSLSLSLFPLFYVLFLRSTPCMNIKIIRIEEKKKKNIKRPPFLLFNL